jgi:hypothetical protein
MPHPIVINFDEKVIERFDARARMIEHDDFDKLVHSGKFDRIINDFLFNNFGYVDDYLNR